ncbi:hypothetical protein EWB00_009710 [Schistosoma japonicum]|uniref:Uncharacterized protein n=1 Tax=Schistosoma japonicum TaxID=6182 RepID=A0A4Z2CM12_SCHJA|nr:hypothetical protein EWB00_009710 [Schistosoma japonicum]
MNIALALLFILQLHSIQLQLNSDIDKSADRNTHNNQNNTETKNDGKSVNPLSQINKTFQSIHYAKELLYEIMMLKEKLLQSRRQLERINTTFANLLNAISQLIELYSTRENFNNWKDQMTQIYTNTENIGIWMEEMKPIYTIMENYENVMKQLNEMNSFNKILPKVIGQTIQLHTILENLREAFQQQNKKKKLKSIPLPDTEKVILAMEAMKGVYKLPENLEMVMKHLNEVNSTFLQINTTVTILQNYLDQQNMMKNITEKIEKAMDQLNEPINLLNNSLDQLDGVYLITENLEIVMKQLNEAMNLLNGLNTIEKNISEDI